MMNVKLRGFAFSTIASLALLASCDRSTEARSASGSDTVTKPGGGSSGAARDPNPTP
jgi:hypothetical protein